MMMLMLMMNRQSCGSLVRPLLRQKTVRPTSVQC